MLSGDRGRLEFVVIVRASRTKAVVNDPIRLKPLAEAVRSCRKSCVRKRG